MLTKNRKRLFDKEFFFLILQFFFSFLFLLTAIIFFTYHFAYRNKIIPQIFVGPFNLSNKTPQEAYDYLQPKLAELNEKKITFQINNQTFGASLENLGFSYNAKASVEKAFLNARSNNLVKDIKTELNAWFRGQKLNPEINFNQDIFETAKQNLFQGFEKPKTNAGFAIKNKELMLTSSEQGFYIDYENLKREIIKRTQKMDFSDQALITQVMPDKPDINVDDLVLVKNFVEKFVFDAPYFFFQNRNYQPTPEQTLSFLKFINKGTIIIAPDQKTIETFISQITEQVNQPAKGQIFEVKDNQVIRFEPSEEGREVDKEKAKELYISNLENFFQTEISEQNKSCGCKFATEIETEGEKKPFELSLDLPVKITPAPENPNEYGIKELLGEGVSNYKGSAPGRIHNIALGSSRLNGILIPVGKTFYFNKNIGEVSDKTGYQTAWVIKGSRTVLGVGGGVCQISTTVFRAALNSGLPIIERAAHAYRVSYYEYESNMGFDATVYAPRPDLIFENDTPAYILITSEVDPKNTRLYFRIYGTSDGRKVEVTGPKIAYQSRPPAPLYQEDPSLPKGVTKQVDFAAWGADVSIYRKVYRNGKVLQDDTFRSIYKPWQAVYLIGTKES